MLSAVTIAQVARSKPHTPRIDCPTQSARKPADIDRDAGTPAQRPGEVAVAPHRANTVADDDESSPVEVATMAERLDGRPNLRGRQPVGPQIADDSSEDDIGV